MEFICREWITVENIRNLFKKYSVPPNFDLLSVDIDYNDFWILQQLVPVYSPRVIIAEVNSHIPPEESRVVKPDPQGWDGISSYFGGSVSAFYKLLKLYNYSLIYCESHGVNCFFVRNDALGVNSSDLILPQDVHVKPNFFGKGWDYKNLSRSEDTWIWI